VRGRGKKGGITEEKKGIYVFLFIERGNDSKREQRIIIKIYIG